MKAVTRTIFEENKHSLQQIELKSSTPSIVTNNSSAIIPFPGNIGPIAKEVRVIIRQIGKHPSLKTMAK
eukprot:15364958-Ditylum_brightwellii.AAC.1